MTKPLPSGTRQKTRFTTRKEIPGLSQPLTFTGQHEKYGVNLSLSQPIYTGGALKGNYEKAKYEQTSAGYRIEQTLNDITYDADCRYWTAVASRELTDVARHYRESVDMLVGVVRHRVEVEFAGVLRVEKPQLPEDFLPPPPVPEAPVPGVRATPPSGVYTSVPSGVYASVVWVWMIRI